MKKKRAVLLAAILMLVCAGCGGNAGNAGTEDAKSETAAVNTSEDTAASNEEETTAAANANGKKNMAVTMRLGGCGHRHGLSFKRDCDLQSERNGGGRNRNNPDDVRALRRRRNAYA